MPGFRDNINRQVHHDLEDFENIISFEEQQGFYILNLDFINASHLDFNQPNSVMSATTKQLIMYLLDEYMPTGIIKFDQLEEPEEILTEIRRQLSENIELDVMLSKRFYEIIPQIGSVHRLQVIDSIEKCNSKLEIIARIRSTLESLNAGIRSSMNPIDYFRKYFVRTQLDEIDPMSLEFQIIKRCIEKTQIPNDHFLRLENLFKVCSHADAKFNTQIRNDHLLYHFTFPANILGILREGLLAAPSHVYSMNRFFGNGIYFWDCASIALHKFRDYPSNRAVLLICRVAIGNQKLVPQLYLNQGEIFELENGMNSLFCQGTHFSNARDEFDVINGAKMFGGQIPNITDSMEFTAFNKYMVPNENQVKIEYIAEFERL